MKITGAIFDMDGTLTDSMFIWRDIGKRYLLSCGIRPSEDLREETKKLTVFETADYFRKKYGLKKTNEEIYAGVDALLWPMYRDEVKPKEGIFLLLDRLKERGVPMVVATATDRHLVEMVLEKNGLLVYFSEIFTTGGIGSGKENPLIFETALNCLGTPKPETIVFEDTLYAIVTAKRAGFPVAGIFDESQDHLQEEIKAVSDFYITDYRKDYLLF
ncbi:MAG: HAD family phosphatase [Oscillospiraceae bacterium]|nr:HAD family phosphatase [Oscillospiraceae bacterium]